MAYDQWFRYLNPDYPDFPFPPAYDIQGGQVWLGDDGYGYNFYVDHGVLGVKISDADFRDLCLKCARNASGGNAYDDKVAVVITALKNGSGRYCVMNYNFSHDYYKLNAQALGLALLERGITVYFHSNAD